MRANRKYLYFTILNISQEVYIISQITHVLFISILKQPQVWAQENGTI